MTIVVKDRVRESTVSAGTGNLQLIGAVSGFQSFAALGDDPEIDTYYAVLDSALGAWETGYGKYIPETQTLVRVEVLESSAANELVDFAPTVKDVFCVYPASKAVTLDEIGNLTLQSLTVVEPIVGGITGNAGTVTDGVYTTGDQTVDGEKTFLQPIAGDITGNAGTVTNGVYTTGDQTVDGEKTFLEPIVGDITGTADNVTGIVAVANGGTGTATPALVAGTNVTITGSWPNQTINASGGGGGDLPSPIVWEPAHEPPTLTIGGTTTTLFRLGATSERIVDLGTIGTAGTQSLDSRVSNNFRCSIGEEITFEFVPSLFYDTAPTISTLSSITIYITQIGGGTPVWPTNVQWADGIAPGYSTESGRTDIFTFLTYDRGTTWLGLLQAVGLRNAV
jgi:hypothetical protein